MRASNLLSSTRRSLIDQPDWTTGNLSHISCLKQLLLENLVGQPTAVQAIVPYVQMFEAGLAPEGRPAGVFLLLGPSGTGKTRTVEVLADALHGCEKNLLKVDCGEFQMEHEVAKLVGAPPGYLGHRETPPLLTQQKINSVSSAQSGLSILLFDEIEKAAPAMTRLLLGVLDKAVLRLGDNTTVNFERTLIFLTSNLGARGMANALNPVFGFARKMEQTQSEVSSKLSRIGMAAVRRKFTPEFVNRIDAVVTYQPLDQSAMEQILEMQIQKLQDHLDDRLGDRSFQVMIPPRSRKVLLGMGTSAEYGARELKRTLHRNLMQPIAAMVAEQQIKPNSVVTLVLSRPASFRIQVKQAA